MDNVIQTLISGFQVFGVPILMIFMAYIILNKRQKVIDELYESFIDKHFSSKTHFDIKAKISEVAGKKYSILYHEAFMLLLYLHEFGSKLDNNKKVKEELRQIESFLISEDTISLWETNKKDEMIKKLEATISTLIEVIGTGEPISEAISEIRLKIHYIEKKNTLSPSDKATRSRFWEYLHSIERNKDVYIGHKPFWRT